MAWFDNDWKFRKKITIDSTKVNATETDFPVLVSIIDTDLRDDAQADGDDILFTQTDQVTKIPHEVELYVGATGELVAWVKVPSVSSAVDTDIYMYYGNPTVGPQQDPTNVWDANFIGVWHLNDDFLDSTANGNDGVNNGSTDILGQIADGKDFDGVGDHIKITQTSGLPVFGTTGYTMEFWVKTIVSQNGETPFAEGNSGNDLPVFFFRALLSDQIRVFIRDDAGGSPLSADSTTTVFQGGFKHVAWVDLNGTAALYINGALDATNFNYTPATTTLNNTTIFAWERTSVINQLEGAGDEYRVSDIVRTGDWIATGFNNQDDPATFFTVGPEILVAFASDQSRKSRQQIPILGGIRA